jgi:hypothetical protein
MLENWVCPSTGKRIRRKFLGAVNYGKLVVRAANGQGHDLYWIGIGDPLAALDGALKTRSAPRRLTDSIFWICHLPPGDYFIDSDKRGRAELFKIHPALPLPADDKPMVPPLGELFGKAVPPPPPPRQPIFIQRPSA